MQTRTKIVCTIGPSVASYSKILQLIDAGMNVARVNMSHGDHSQHQKTIDMLKKGRIEKKSSLAIMLDTKGPEIRVCKIQGERLILKRKQKLKIVRSSIEGSDNEISLIPFDIIDDIPLHAIILFDDGYITSKVIEKTKDYLVIRIENPAILESQKGVNIPYVDLSLPAITEQDQKDIIFGCKNEVDILAASFIRSASHVLEIKKLLTQHGAGSILVVAKVENALGVKNFDSILQVSDGIMVARGDLGVELPITEVPKLQKMMIRKCCQACKPVVIATQMLDSMIKHPRPTRAEVSDVANAIYDSASAVMLSGETAIGKYPIETVRLMRNTIIATEKEFSYEEFFYHDVAKYTFNDISASVALAAVKTAYAGHGKALIALTTGGFTARIMSRFRPKMPIIAITPNERTYHQLTFSWGIIPVLASFDHLKEGVAKASCFALKNRLLQYGDLIIVTSGSPFGITGTTNTMLVDHIGNVLVRGVPGRGKKVYGKICFILTHEIEENYDLKKKIVIFSHFKEHYESFLHEAMGIILQNSPDDFHSEEMAKKVAEKLNISLLLRADGACSILKEGEVVTLDPAKGLIFKGIIDSEEEMLAQICQYKDH